MVDYFPLIELIHFVLSRLIVDRGKLKLIYFCARVVDWFNGQERKPGNKVVQGSISHTLLTLREVKLIKR